LNIQSYIHSLTHSRTLLIEKKGKRNRGERKLEGEKKRETGREERRERERERERERV
jgi:hypothetical protein